MKFYYNSTIKQNNSYNPTEKIKFLPKFYNHRQTKTKKTWTFIEEVEGLKKKRGGGDWVETKKVDVLGAQITI